ncbi:MAG: (d)CMP kinase [Bdellovibrionota bacterium]|nr:cytidylate kinase [Pseudobdellovibrionaceae bacterium]MAF92582.1 cytidylate kinase [Pseudobdellovibrionaceae bacterium]
MVVTIDGPAASGKSSVSRDLAKKLGWKWVSTGAFYRGLAYVAANSDIDLDSEKEVLDVATGESWLVVMAPEKTEVHFKGEDVSDKVFSEGMGAVASKISQYPKVREALLEPQRQCAENVAGLVAEGRDCGSVVFPNAEVKIYLTANEKLRAARRAMQTGDDIKNVQAKTDARDKQDSTRKTAPMTIPENAVVVETSELSLEEVVDKVYGIIQESLKS